MTPEARILRAAKIAAIRSRAEEAFRRPRRAMMSMGHVEDVEDLMARGLDTLYECVEELAKIAESEL